MTAPRGTPATHAPVTRPVQDTTQTFSPSHQRSDATRPEHALHPMHATQAAPRRRRLDELNEEECRQLLGTAVIGRIAFMERVFPVVQPVHFALIGNDVYIPTRNGSKLAAAGRNAPVAFEVDAFDPSGRTGWNVTAVGRSRVVTGAGDIAELAALGLSPWAPAAQLRYIAIRVTRLTGRRVHLPVP